MTMSALGRQVGLSAPSVTERVQRLQQTGVIAGFRMDVDPAASGCPSRRSCGCARRRVSSSRLAELAASIDQVSECHRITGEDCFLVKVHAETVAALEDVLDRFLVHGQTISSIVVTSPVPPRPLPIPD